MEAAVQARRPVKDVFAKAVSVFWGLPIEAGGGYARAKAMLFPKMIHPFDN